MSDKPILQYSLLKKTEGPRESAFERLRKEFHQHGHEETEVINGYSKMVSKTESETLKFLLGMIIEDEKRHHEIMRRLVATLDSALLWTETRMSIAMDKEPAKNKKELLKLTTEFLRIEKQLLRDDQNLLKIDVVKETPLFRTAVKATQMDGRKHVEILKAIKSLLKS
ncbi:MAG: hypothetical protein IH932_01495 [Thaumarchaeota archaeon]|nr:hypothetical protein [Nitrososphaerota archaeon]